MLTRYEDGRKFRRSILGYRTETAATDASKHLWRMGYVVKVEQIGSRWHVWWSV